MYKMFSCKFCDRTSPNKGGITKHQIGCKNNPDARKCGGNRSPRVAWNKGLNKDADERVAISTKTKEKLRKVWLGRKHTDETKDKMSKTKKKMYEDGFECVAGRCKKYSYESPIAGSIKVDGSWELEFCKFADKYKLTWVRNKKI